MEPQSIAAWPSRAVIATRGNQTLIGCIVLAILGKAASNPPRIVGAAEIRADGQVIAPMQSRRMSDGETELLALCSASQLRDGLNRIGDAIHATEDERAALFEEARKWIAKDWRATSGDWLKAGEGRG